MISSRSLLFVSLLSVGVELRYQVTWELPVLPSSDFPEGLIRPEYFLVFLNCLGPWGP